MIESRKLLQLVSVESENILPLLLYWIKHINMTPI